MFMKDIDTKGITLKYVFYGFLIGLTFPLAAILADIYFKELPLSLSGIGQAFGLNPILWVVSTAPFVLSIMAYLIGKSIAKRTEAFRQTTDIQIKKAEKIYAYTEKLANGEIDIDYEFNGGANKKDKIGLSLLKLRDFIKKIKEEETLRRKEEQHITWSSQGLAMFGDILRQNNDNINELSYHILSNLVKYVDAKQGGFFIINDNNPNDKHFEMTACYAYNRKKFAEKRIEWEEGLIGACALEMNTILLKEIPEEHVTITSGLGETIPDCLILIPLKSDEEVHGVIELASLKVFSKHEIAFMEKLAEAIASVIARVKINIKTTYLLSESQQQAKLMATQEEEMRRSMEELQFAKEEAAKQAEMLANFTNAVNHTLLRAEYSTAGILLYANTRFLSKLGYSGNKEVEGKHISLFINEKDNDWFFKIWDGLAKGGKHFEGDMKHVTKQGKDFWSMATYTCIRNNDGGIEKIMFLGIDITEQKKYSLDYEAQINALNQSNLKAEYLPNGSFIEANNKFHEFAEIDRKNIDKITVFNFMGENTDSLMRKTWEEILQGIPHENQVQLNLPSGERKWMQGIYTIARDMYGDVSKVIYLGSDITQKKLIELEIERQTQQLKEQENLLKTQQSDTQKQFEEFRARTQQQINDVIAAKTRYERTLEAHPDAVIIMNQHEAVEFFNKAAEELWGINRLSIVGKSIKLILPPPHNKAEDGKIISFLTSEMNHLRGTRTETKIVRFNGEILPVIVIISESKIGKEYTYTAFVQNISV